MYLYFSIFPSSYRVCTLRTDGLAVLQGRLEQTEASARMICLLILYAVSWILRIDLKYVHLINNLSSDRHNLSE